MVDVEKKKLKGMLQEIVHLEERKSDINAEIKEHIEAFCKEHEVSTKAFREILKIHKANMKDPAKTTVESEEVEELKTILYGTTE